MLALLFNSAARERGYQLSYVCKCLINNPVIYDINPGDKNGLTLSWKGSNSRAYLPDVRKALSLINRRV